MVYPTGGQNIIKHKLNVTQLDNQASGKYEEGVEVTTSDTLQDILSTHDVDRSAKY